MTAFFEAIRRLVHQLRRRGVIRVAAVYLGTSFVIIQAAEILVPVLRLPGWTLRHLARAYARAIRALEKEGPGIFYMKLHPFFDPLRDDPRIERLLEQAGLDEASVEKTMRQLGEPMS